MGDGWPVNGKVSMGIVHGPRRSRLSRWSGSSPVRRRRGGSPGEKWRCGGAESSFELRRSSMTCTEGGNDSVPELSMVSYGGQNRRARQRLPERTTGRWRGQNVRGLSPFIGTPRMRATRSARGWDGWGTAAHAWQARRAWVEGASRAAAPVATRRARERGFCPNAMCP
jgi:hypothetical protein